MHVETDLHQAWTYNNKEPTVKQATSLMIMAGLCELTIQ